MSVGPRHRVLCGVLLHYHYSLQCWPIAGFQYNRLTVVLRSVMVESCLLYYSYCILCIYKELRTHCTYSPVHYTYTYTQMYKHVSTYKTTHTHTHPTLLLHNSRVYVLRAQQKTSWHPLTFPRAAASRFHMNSYFMFVPLISYLYGRIYYRFRSILRKFFTYACIVSIDLVNLINHRQHCTLYSILSTKTKLKKKNVGTNYSLSTRFLCITSLISVHRH